MKTLDFFCGDSAEMVVALGFFDSIHVGHATIINKAQKIAKSHMVDCAVFTFVNDIDCLFKNSPTQYIPISPRPLAQPPCILLQNNIIIGSHIRLFVFPSLALSNKYRNKAKKRLVNNRHLVVGPKFCCTARNIIAKYSML